MFQEASEVSYASPARFFLYAYKKNKTRRPWVKNSCQKNCCERFFWPNFCPLSPSFWGLGRFGDQKPLSFGRVWPITRPHAISAGAVFGHFLPILGKKGPKSALSLYRGGYHRYRGDGSRTPSPSPPLDTGKGVRPRSIRRNGCQR